MAAKKLEELMQSLRTRLSLLVLLWLRVAMRIYRLGRRTVLQKMKNRASPINFSKIRTRDNLVDWIQQKVNGNILEIGPFDCPLVRGPNVKYFDVMDQAGLIQRALSIGRTGNLQGVPVIDYVDPQGDLRCISDSFEICISSHVIEHQPDLIRHFQEISALLESNGAYIVLVPDKRYCFDHFISESTIADILDAHIAGRSQHTLKSVIEHRSMTCHNVAAMHWIGQHGAGSIAKESVLAALEEYTASRKTGEYIDVHAWQFTPQSFRQILKLLNELEYIDLSLEHTFETRVGQLEFFAVLRKRATCKTSRENP